MNINNISKNQRSETSLKQEYNMTLDNSKANIGKSCNPLKKEKKKEYYVQYTYKWKVLKKKKLPLSQKWTVHQRTCIKQNFYL